MRWDIHSHVHNSRLLWITQQEGMMQEENTDAFEIISKHISFWNPYRFGTGGQDVHLIHRHDFSDSSGAFEESCE